MAGLDLDSLPLWMSQVDFGGLKQKLIASPSVAAARRHFGDPVYCFFAKSGGWLGFVNHKTLIRRKAS
jgi:hypothetical protein